MEEDLKVTINIHDPERDTIFDKAREWIRYWGSGGGCFSLESWVLEKIDELESDNPSASEEELIEFLLDADPGYGCEEQYESLVRDIEFED